MVHDADDWDGRRGPFGHHRSGGLQHGAGRREGSTISEGPSLGQSIKQDKEVGTGRVLARFSVRMFGRNTV